MPEDEPQEPQPRFFQMGRAHADDLFPWEELVLEMLTELPPERAHRILNEAISRQRLAIELAIIALEGEG